MTLHAVRSSWCALGAPGSAKGARVSRSALLRVSCLALVLGFGVSTVTANAAEPDFEAISTQITQHHEASIKQLQEWIALPSISAENLNMREGAEYMSALAREAGFQQVEIIDTDGDPGVFATLDAGAKKTVGVYFMYDVKQFDPAEWSSPPLEAKLVDKPGLGKVMIGRGAVNQKGPELAFLHALRAIREAKQTLPVNLVLIAEGEEEVGSPHIRQLAYHPKVRAALEKCIGVFMPFAKPQFTSDG